MKSKENAYILLLDLLKSTVHTYKYTESPFPDFYIKTVTSKRCSDILRISSSGLTVVEHEHVKKDRSLGLKIQNSLKTSGDSAQFVRINYGFQR